MTYWLNIAGRKPLAHLPRWQRHLLHLPTVRWRLWPRPWNFNGPVAGWRKERERDRALIMRLWTTYCDLVVQLPEDRRTAWMERGEAVFTSRQPMKGTGA